MYDPEAILQIKESTTTRICTGENLYYMREFIPYFELHAADVMMIDVAWNGFTQSKKIGDLAEVYQTNIAPPQLLQPYSDVHEREPMRRLTQCPHYGNRY